MNRVLRQLRRTAFRSAHDGPSDASLLECFLTRRDEAAFEAILRRHGPMVLGVCRRVLRHAEDVEDAFQATFLVLVRKAAGLRSRDLLGNWLYGVAHRTALKARAMSAKRRARERQLAERPASEASVEGQTADELLPLLDAALARLPDRYRVPIVLCELEGRGRKEVARLLGLPEGTLSWRLAHARKLLARRLSRHGAVLSTAGLAAALAVPSASARVPTPLLSTTARAAVRVVSGESLKAGAFSARVVTLTEGVLKAMFLSKLKTVGAVALVVALGAGAVGLTYRPAVAQDPSPYAARPAEKLPPAARAQRPAPDELEELRLEVAALRKGLEVTRQRVKVLEGEVRSLKGGRPTTLLDAAGAAADALKVRDAEMIKRVEEVRQQAATPQPDPFAEAEAALKRLRQRPDDPQAAEALERALRRLKKGQKPEGYQPAKP